MESAREAKNLTTTMQAFMRDAYGTSDVLELRTTTMPTVEAHQVLVRVHASSVNPYELHMMTGLPYLARISEGIRAPKNPRLGGDVSGTIEAVGSDVTTVAVGDEVFGVCNGAYAEYAVARADRVVPKPPNLTFEEAASIPLAAVTALQGLRDKGRIAAGHNVLINGASGGIGTFAVQIAKSFGATVTGVCSTRNLEMVRSIGADHVVDYTEDDYTRTGQRYDIILDTVASKSMRNNRRALVDDGRYVMVGVPKAGNWIDPLLYPLRALALSRFSSQTLTPMLATYSEEDLQFLQKLAEDGDLKPVISQRFSLSETPDALRHQAAGHARGKTVISVIGDSQ